MTFVLSIFERPLKTGFTVVALTLSLLGNFACLFLSSADFFQINVFKKFFRKYHQSVKKFVSRSGPTFIHHLSFICN